VEVNRIQSYCVWNHHTIPQWIPLVHLVTTFSLSMASVLTPPRQLAPTMGLGVLAPSLRSCDFFPISLIMVSGGALVEGREIRLGALTFIADDSAWLQEAPLDVDALPVRGATHFRACVRGVLLRQPSTQYRSAPVASSRPISRQCKRSGRSRLQRWVRHAVARQSATPQVAAIEPDESLYGLFDLSTGSAETASECDSSDPAAEVLVIDGPHSPPGSPALTEARMGATRRVLTRSISPSLSRHCSGRNFAAGTWMHSTLLSLEKPPRPEPWRTRAWLTWPSALDWRISSEYSTSERVNRLHNPVDVISFRPCRYIVLRFRIWRLRPI